MTTDERMKAYLTMMVELMIKIDGVEYINDELDQNVDTIYRTIEAFVEKYQ